jgi:autotransporter strand-loop-strand O-heptosyltransferase
MRGIQISFLDGVQVTLADSVLGGYYVQIRDSRTNEILFGGQLNSYSVVSYPWQNYVPWHIEFFQGGLKIGEFHYDLKGMTVLINMSSNLGDSLLWIEAVETFRKQHKCKVLCGTNYGDFLKESYPEIEFHPQGTDVEAFMAGYNIMGGPEDTAWRTEPIGHVAPRVLGLPIKDYRPKLKIKECPVKMSPYVCINTQSTLKCKEWQNPRGWGNLVNFLKSQGYDVLDVSQKPLPVPGVVTLQDLSLSAAAEWISGCEFFIGYSAGLTWVAWGLGKKCIVISGYTAEWYEPTEDIYRVINKKVCNGCFNDPSLPVPSGWEWCPRGRDFECTKRIGSFNVVEQYHELKKSLEN